MQDVVLCFFVTSKCYVCVWFGVPFVWFGFYCDVFIGFVHFGVESVLRDVLWFD